MHSFLSKVEHQSLHEHYVSTLKRNHEELLLLKKAIAEEKIESARLAFLQCRLTFKSIEFLIEQLDPQFVKDHLNGAPLPKLERNVGNKVILEPSGFQAIDEALFASQEIDWEHSFSLVKKLIEHFHSFYLYQQRATLIDRIIIEGCRTELLRIFTMGITGFDKPYSPGHFEEVKAALSGVNLALSYYDEVLLTKDANIVHKKRGLFKKGERLLRNQEFESFDRFGFYQKVIQPLYALIYDIHKILKVETIDLVTPLKQPTNYHVKDLFDEEFLNASYFTLLDNLGEPEKIEDLGKILFFDPILSVNNKRACASCHQPNKAFSDGVDKSLALNFVGNVGRNAPGLINTAFATSFFHDLRAKRLSDQPTHVVLNPKEFGTNYFELISKLKKSPEYSELFEEAFSKVSRDPLSKMTVNAALAAYIRSLKGFNSDFDQMIRNERIVDSEVIKGFNLFMGKGACATCHFPPSFAGLVPPLYKESESEILGVLAKYDTINPLLDNDSGRRGTGIPADDDPIFDRAFKTPTVRNISLTSPYMHNGAFQSLEQVVDFYNRGGGSGMGLEVPFQTLPSESLELTALEQKQIIVFMEALNDTIDLNSKPSKLPFFPDSLLWNERKIGGDY